MALDDLEEAYTAMVPAQIEHAARVYAQSFSEQELTQLVAFEESPAGRTLAALTAQMQSSSSAYGKTVTQAAIGSARTRLCGQISCLDAPAAAP